MTSRTEQQSKLRLLLRTVLESNSFYRHKLRGLSPAAAADFRREDLEELPLTCKQELVADQEANPPFGSNLTYPLESYVRLHQTSGTTGKPLRWLDTPQSWQWWLECWKEIFRRAGVTRRDRVFVAFSFGPFIGFWAAFEAARELGAMTLPGGGLSSEERLWHMRENGATVLVSTPTYALRLAEVARRRGWAIDRWDVRLGVHAGEPGASIPNVKRRIEEAWGMRCVDHAGATEVGAWGVCTSGDGEMQVLESEFIAEVFETGGDRPAQPDADGLVRGELVITSLGRLGSPVIRYRTGDLVKLRPGSGGGASPAVLCGGVLARVDGMVIVRGVNVYPSAIENLVRELEDVSEFQAEVRRTGNLARLRIYIETTSEDAHRTARRLAELCRRRLQLRTEVEVAAPGSLPRFELKARRFKIVDD